MLKRPSSRSRSTHQQLNLNLVPMIDAMVTLIGFMLFTTSFISLVHIESPFPTASPENFQEKLKEKPLQLTVSIREKETEVWSPFERIQPKTIANTAPRQPDFRLLHETLVAIKQQFPFETKIVVVPIAEMTYDLIIAAMDSIRMLEPTDPPLFVKNGTTGNDEAIKTLFPDVIFGNLLGDT